MNALRWNQALLDGAVRSMTELANQNDVTQRYVARIITLAFLAPAILQAALRGQVPSDLSLDRLNTGFPLDWDEQRLAEREGFEPPILFIISMRYKGTVSRSCLWAPASWHFLSRGTARCASLRIRTPWPSRLRCVSCRAMRNALHFADDQVVPAQRFETVLRNRLEIGNSNQACKTLENAINRPRYRGDDR